MTRHWACIGVAILCYAWRIPLMARPDQPATSRGYEV